MKKIIMLLLVMMVVVGVTIFFAKNKSPNYCQNRVVSEEVGYNVDAGSNGIAKNPKRATGSESKNKISKFPTRRDATETTILALESKKDDAFSINQSKNSADGKYWNKARTFNLKKTSVWYDLYNHNGDFIRRLQRYINVDPTAGATSTDHMADDIQWRWLDDNHLIGVQEINHRDSQVLKKEAHECVPGKSCCTELIVPDSARIYILDARAEDKVYELDLPELPVGLVVRLDGINTKGYLSLSAVSPIDYHQNKRSDNPLHYKKLGVFEVEGLVDE